MLSGATSSRTSTTRSLSSSGPRRVRACCRHPECACTCDTAEKSGERSPSSVLILAFDTATSVATSALVRDGAVLGERATAPVRVLEDIDVLLRDANVDARKVDALAVG